MSEIVNIAGYQFVRLDELPERKQRLLEECKRLGVKGTILLSPEGINLFLAAERHAVDSFLAFLRSDPKHKDFYAKESPSDNQPFNRLLVRLKKEIIAFGIEGIDPQTRTSPKLKPAELKQWLDEGKPVTLLDVRNNYEVEIGTFENAVVADIDNFKQFPEAVERLGDEKKDQPIVMFCTGGIRCEKAGPFMEQAGFQSIYQLDGGILQYFEDVGGEHYDGDCFVFDQRVAVDPDLKETDAEVCFACQAVLLPEHRASPQYVPAESCPKCYLTDKEKSQRLVEKRRSQIIEAATPLPGSVPYDNYRPLNVPARFHGCELLEFLAQYHPHIDQQEWQVRIEQGRMLFDGTVLAADYKVRDGQRLEHLIPSMVEQDVNAAIDFIAEDDCLVVVNKPAPLPMHPSGRFNRNTLTWLLDQIYDNQLRVTHRLDANTTGVVVFSKTRKIASILHPQFEKQKVEKVYLALVHGQLDRDSFEVNRPITDAPTIAGGRRVEPAGKQSVTEFRVVEKGIEFNGSTCSLVEARPKTGRTNQIRIHLWHIGNPIVGDPTYLPGQQMAQKQTLQLSDPSMCLHSWRLSFLHPASMEPVSYEAAPPEWAKRG